MTKTKKVFGWKKCWAVDKYNKLVVNREGNPVTILVKLEIRGAVCVPSGPVWLRNTTLTKKRTDKAKVLEIQGLKKGQHAVSMWVRREGVSGNVTTGLFVYTKDKIVTPMLPFNSSEDDSCGSGINYFSTKREAERYVFRP